MYLNKKFKVFCISLLLLLHLEILNALENKILFKVDNEIVTTLDIYEEIKFLKAFNPEIDSLDEKELFEISKNNILKNLIKKIELSNFVEELKVDDKFLLKLIKEKYSKKEIDSIENFDIFLRNKNLNIKMVKEKFTIELIWNDLIFQKFSKKIVIDKDKIKEEISQNYKNELQRELLLSEIIFDVSDKDDFNRKYEKILKDIENLGFKKTALIHSNSETSANGGLIGWVKEDNLNQTLKTVLIKLKPGQFSKPIRTSSGFIIVKVDDEKEYKSKVNLSDRINEVIRFKTNDQLNQYSTMYLNKLKKNLIIYGL